MQTRIKPAYYLILLVYALIIGGLLFREFGEGGGVNYSLGEIRISAAQNAAVSETFFSSPGGSYRSLELSFRSFRLAIPDSGEAVEVLADGSERPITIRSLNRSSGDITVVFGSGIELRVFEIGEAENAYAVSVDFSKSDESRLTGIRLPWSGREPEIHGSLPLLRASPAGTAGGVVLLPPGGRVSAGSLSLRRGEDPEELLLLRDGEDAGLTALWFERRGGLVSNAAYREALAEFFQAAYSGWQGERWLSDAGTWEYQADSPPESVTASQLLIESLPRGSYFSTRMRLASGSSRLIDETSALFLGSVTVPFREMASSTQNLAAAVSGRAAGGDGTLFLDLDELMLTLDAGLAGAGDPAEELAILAETVILAEPQTEEELIAAINAARYLQRYAADQSSGIRYLIREELMPRIAPIAKGYGVRFGDRIDSRVSAAAGVLMSASDDQFTRDLGHTLLASIFSAAGEYARTPEAWLISEFAADPSGTILEPESLTPMLPRPLDSPYRPRPLDLGPGEGWIWTCAGDVRYEAGQNAVLSFRFPTGGVHHFALFDVDPFDELQMHGIPWNSDPEFQRYSDGWVYDSRRRALFVKITHRSERQTIRIIRRPPEPASTEGTAAPEA